MTATRSRQIVLAARPVGLPKPGDFRLVETPVPEPAPGEMLVRARYLSLDPYMRGRMSDARSYARPVEIGEVMVGAIVGEVVRSRHPDFVEGDVVEERLGWQEYYHRRDEGLRQLAEWLRAGKLRHREDVADGLENAPAAFIGMLQGRNFGKQLVRLA